MATYSSEFGGENNCDQPLAELLRLFLASGWPPPRDALVYDDDTGAVVGYLNSWHGCIYSGPPGQFHPSEKLFDPARDIPRAPDLPSPEKPMTIKEAALGAGVAFAIMPGWVFPWALGMTAVVAADAIVQRLKRKAG